MKEEGKLAWKIQIRMLKSLETFLAWVGKFDEVVKG